MSDKLMSVMGELLDDNAVDNITIDSGVEDKVIIGGDEDVDVVEAGSGEGDDDTDTDADDSSVEEAGSGEGDTDEGGDSDADDSEEEVDVNGAYRDWETDRKSTRLNSSHRSLSRMPSSA